MDHLERLDRRAFLRGLMVTSAGLLVARPTIILPAARRFACVTKASDTPDWNDWKDLGGGPGSDPYGAHPFHVRFDPDGVTREQFEHVRLIMRRGTKGPDMIGVDAPRQRSTMAGRRPVSTR